MKAFRVLIASLFPFKGGKTTLVEGVGRGLRDEGFKVGYLKPFSSHNWYLDYDVLITNMNYGTVFPGDVIKVSESMGIKDVYETMSPISLLTAQLRPSAFIEARSETLIYAYFSDLFRRTVACRLSYCKEREVWNTLYLNEWLIVRNLAIINDKVLERIRRKSNLIYKLSDYKILPKTLLTEYNNSIRSTIRYLETKYRILLIESYRDSAWPLPLDEDVDLVFVVAPGQVLVYDSKRFKTAVVLKYSRYFLPLDVSLRDIIGIISPIETMEVEPISSFDIPESISEKFNKVTRYLVKLIEQ
ncbi:MAG: hypothetical protein DRJ41_02145 [Thermoprotei archaeon]|nr:MAG: hypothetical protein DRJ41_02145 [Thermoprotei archaeon]